MEDNGSSDKQKAIDDTQQEADYSNDVENQPDEYPEQYADEIPEDNSGATPPEQVEGQQPAQDTAGEFQNDG